MYGRDAATALSRAARSLTEACARKCAAKGSEEAKKQMEKVRAAQWAKNGLQQMNKC